MARIPNQISKWFLGLTMTNHQDNRPKGTDGEGTDGEGTEGAVTAPRSPSAGPSPTKSSNSFERTSAVLWRTPSWKGWTG